MMDYQDRWWITKTDDGLPRLIIMMDDRLQWQITMTGDGLPRQMMDYHDTCQITMINYHDDGSPWQMMAYYNCCRTGRYSQSLHILTTVWWINTVQRHAGDWWWITVLTRSSSSLCRSSSASCSSVASRLLSLNSACVFLQIECIWGLCLLVLQTEHLGLVWYIVEIVSFGFVF